MGAHRAVYDPPLADVDLVLPVTSVGDGLAEVHVSVGVGRIVGIRVRGPPRRVRGAVVRAVMKGGLHEGVG
jgi:hypothetical protein